MSATTPQTTKERTHVPISGVLHGVIKAECETKGRIMKRVIEEKLWELFPEHPDNPYRQPAEGAK